MKYPRLLFLFAFLALATPVFAQNDSVTVGPTQNKLVQPVELWTWTGSAWVRASAGGGSGGSTAGATGTQVTPTITSVTTGGTVASGSRGVTFIFSSNFSGTVLGVAYSGTTDASQPLVPPPGCTLAAVAYTVTAGSIRIVDIR